MLTFDLTNLIPIYLYTLHIVCHVTCLCQNAGWCDTTRAQLKPLIGLE